MIQFYAIFPIVPGIRDALGGHIPLVTAIATSLTITIFELVPLRITPKITVNDNLAVPVLAGFILRLMVDAGC